MPAPSINTIRDLIYYQYAKIIADSVGIKKSSRGAYYGFVIDRVNKLRSGEITMSSITRELKAQIRATDNECVYCKSRDELSWDHIIPRVKGGLDTAENLVRCCKSCNSSKGSKGIYSWVGIDNKDSLPRLIAGKYLKLLFDLHKNRGTLDSSSLKSHGKLDVLDLEVF